MPSGLIFAATPWATNADLIADCVRLGYLKDTLTLDPTYGKGNFWTAWRPTDLVKHDLKLDGVDFRSMPYDSESFGQIVFDPPYVSMGGRLTSGIPGMMDAFGMRDAPRTPAGVQQLINDGMLEMHRLLEKKGILLVKCTNYISSGKFWSGTFFTEEFARGLQLEVIDRMEHIGKSGGPQPVHARQVHSRRNLSTLFVFKKVS